MKSDVKHGNFRRAVNREPPADGRERERKEGGNGEKKKNENEREKWLGRQKGREEEGGEVREWR